jgi:curved DNA-binding protein CbpA
MRNRRAVLEGLGKILDAGALEELFIGPDEEAAFLYDLLVESARARSSVYYWEICRTARRRGVTPDYVIDRASVLLGAMAERRRTDLYRILGVPALSSAETIRQRWLDVAKESHPDVGGNGAAFRRAKEAYEILRDPDRRADYERFWVRALAPFERVVDRDEVDGAQLSPAPPPPAPAGPARVTIDERPVPPGEPPDLDSPLGVLHAAAQLFAQRAALDRRFDGRALSHGPGLAGVLAGVEAALAPVSRAELDELRTEVDRLAAAVETWRERLVAIAALKQRLGA